MAAPPTDVRVTIRVVTVVCELEVNDRPLYSFLTSNTQDT